MSNVFIVGKKGSQSKIAITKNTPLRLYKGQPGADAIVNYGLAGDRLRNFLGRHHSARVPIINKYIGVSKYTAIKDAEREGIQVPESRMSLPRLASISGWIEKRIHSSQGNGICAARARGQLPGKYYQKMIGDRKFELRVHAFMWLPKNEWSLHKRTGPSDQIAWNFHQGGHFITVHHPNGYRVFKEAKDIAERILTIRKMSFGAVDLIVDNQMNIYFIEVNSSPGFTELSQGIYFNAFTRLAELSPREVKKYGV